MLSLTLCIQASTQELRLPLLSHFCQLDLVREVVAATGPLCIDGRRRRDCFNIAIKRSGETGKWHADIGKIEAVLSLWMATIEAKRTEEERLSSELKTAADVSSIRAPSNWRRTKAGVDLRHDLCRLLGDNFEDGILKRDLAWWVDDLIADQSDALSPDKGESQKPGQQGDSKLAPRKKDKRPAEIVVNKPSWQRSVARTEAKGLVVGFNGSTEDGKPCFP